jgi:hypothetical protein
MYGCIRAWQQGAGGATKSAGGLSELLARTTAVRDAKGGSARLNEEVCVELEGLVHPALVQRIAKLMFLRAENVDFDKDLTVFRITVWSVQSYVDD